MSTFLRVVLIGLMCAFSVSHAALANERASLSPTLHVVNPDMLSGGLFAALDAAGVFGAVPTPSRARASYPDTSEERFEGWRVARFTPSELSNPTRIRG